MKRAGMDEPVDEFIVRCAKAGLYMAGLVSVLVFLLTSDSGGFWWAIIAFPIAAPLMFVYLLKSPIARVAKKEKEINREILFAGRFMVIELQSGVPLYDALKNAATQYKALAPYIREIITKVDLGTSMDDALNETVEIIPSESFRKILWQILNSLHTGADIANSLLSVLEQITRSQMIEIGKYGRKLNPMAMFYMMVAVIVPTLGITMLVVLATMTGFSLKLPILLMIAGLVACVQIMFLIMIKNSRPAVEL